MYDREFKLQFEKGYGVRETVKFLGISRATLAGWIRELRGMKKLKLSPAAVNAAGGGLQQH